ncbi:MAG: tRNA (N(6)-L-threonylcarbamoyladenosine(37)-C(2))-methylthiotransferase MtaB [Eubacterium sp.]|nr:tRNA (N(6)-L-threonylcarbamoyladenosine(37)-C(2))-methylthiotransferase MtaB [Eubacterium sp.]
MSDNLKNRSVYILTLGCKVNQYESDAMLEELCAAGCIKAEAVSNDNKSDVIDDSSKSIIKADISIVNTCSVTNIADRKSRQMLHRMKKQNPDTVVVAVGCYVQAAADSLLKDESVDIVIGNNRKKDIVRILSDYFEGKQVKDNLIDINKDNTYENLKVSQPVGKTRAYIKIQDGCNLFCTYCIIPYVRGRIRSKSIPEILEEMNTLAQNGIKEVVLTGINICSYNDNGKDFLDLLRELKQASDKIIRIRLGSLEPRIVTEEFINIIKNDKRICPHFHLSLQSLCDNTLKRMNRHYTVEDIKNAVRLLRENFDRPALTADVIAGFAGETEADFYTTLDNLTEIKLYETHIFKYSRRKGTVADKMPDQVPDNIKAERSDKMIRIGDVNKASYERSFKGERLNILVEEIIEKDGELFFRGHTERYMLIDVKCKDIVDLSPADSDAYAVYEAYINEIITITY